jgi:hypothetical protein
MVLLTKWKLEKILAQPVWLNRRKNQLCKHLGSNPYTLEEMGNGPCSYGAECTDGCVVIYSRI